MKFIFPQNYNFESKLLGIMDYSTAILNAVWGVVSFGIVNIFPFGISIKIFLFIVLFFPVLLFSIVGFNGENIINVFNYIIKYITSPKVLLYKK